MANRKLSDIKYSILEVAAVGVDISIPEVLENSLEIAQLAEKSGYTRFWLAEHHNTIAIASSATSVLVGYIASGTKTLRVGSGGVMLPNHSPLIVAEQYGTLGNLYPNRIDLGLGRAPGTDQLTAQAIRSDRMRSVYQFPQEVEEIRQYFSKSNAASKVRATMAEGVDVPVYILGSSTDSAELAASQGLPYVFASHFAPAQLFNALQLYYSKFEPSPQLEKPYTAAGINVVVADTDEEAKKLATSLYLMMYGFFTRKMEYLPKPTAVTPEITELMNHPTMREMLKYTFIGTPEKVAEQTRDFAQKTGVDELITTSYIYDQKDRLKSVRLFAEIMRGE